MHDQNMNHSIINNIYIAGKRIVEFSLCKHSRVLIFRFIVRFPKLVHYQEPNRLFSSFIAGFCKNLNNQTLFPSYFWVREQDTSQNPHFHVLMTINGRTKKHPKPIFDMGARLWNTYVGTEGERLIERHYKGGNCIRITQKDRGTKHFESAYREVDDWIIYMAKDHTKDQNVKHAKMFSTSQISYIDKE